MLPINRNPGVKEVRAFTRIWFPLFVAFFSAMLWWRGASLTAAVVVWAVGLLAVGFALVSAEFARILFVGLVTVSYPIGLVLSTLALAVMFYLVFTPLGFVMRLGGRDPLRLGARNAASHWTAYEQSDDPQRAFRQY